MKKVELVEKTYSTQEVVEICKIPLSTLRRYLAEEKIPEVQRLGRDLRFPASWVEKWRVPGDHIKLSAYATKYSISRQTAHTWIEQGRVVAQQSFTGHWWIKDVKPENCSREGL